MNRPAKNNLKYAKLLRFIILVIRQSMCDIVFGATLTMMSNEMTANFCSELLGFCDKDEIQMCDVIVQLSPHAIRETF